MKTKAEEIYESLNVPYKNGGIEIHVDDIQEMFNFDNEYVIKEYPVEDTFKNIEVDIDKITIEKGYRNIALFFVVSVLKYEALGPFGTNITKRDLFINWGAYVPNEGEADRIVAIMQ